MKIDFANENNVVRMSEIKESKNGVLAQWTDPNLGAFLDFWKRELLKQLKTEFTVEEKSKAAELAQNRMVVGVRRYAITTLMSSNRIKFKYASWGFTTKSSPSGRKEITFIRTSLEPSEGIKSEDTGALPTAGIITPISEKHSILVKASQDSLEITSRIVWTPSEKMVVAVAYCEKLLLDPLCKPGALIEKAQKCLPYDRQRTSLWGVVGTISRNLPEAMKNVLATKIGASISEALASQTSSVVKEERGEFGADVPNELGDWGEQITQHVSAILATTQSSHKQLGLVIYENKIIQSKLNELISLGIGVETEDEDDDEEEDDEEEEEEEQDSAVYVLAHKSEGSLKKVKESLMEDGFKVFTLDTRIINMPSLLRELDRGERDYDNRLIIVREGSLTSYQIKSLKANHVTWHTLPKLTPSSVGRVINQLFE